MAHHLVLQKESYNVVASESVYLHVHVLICTVHETFVYSIQLQDNWHPQLPLAGSPVSRSGTREDYKAAEGSYRGGP